MHEFCFESVRAYLYKYQQHQLHFSSRVYYIIFMKSMCAHLTPIKCVHRILLIKNYKCKYLKEVCVCYQTKKNNNKSRKIQNNFTKIAANSFSPGLCFFAL